MGSRKWQAKYRPDMNDPPTARLCEMSEESRALSNLSTITGREGGLAPADYVSRETIPGLSVPIVEIIKQRGQAHLPDLLSL